MCNYVTKLIEETVPCDMNVTCSREFGDADDCYYLGYTFEAVNAGDNSLVGEYVDNFTKFVKCAFGMTMIRKDKAPHDDVCKMRSTAATKKGYHYLTEIAGISKPPECALIEPFWAQYGYGGSENKWQIFTKTRIYALYLAICISYISELKTKTNACENSLPFNRNIVVIYKYDFEPIQDALECLLDPDELLIKRFLFRDNRVTISERLYGDDTEWACRDIFNDPNLMKKDERRLLREGMSKKDVKNYIGKKFRTIFSFYVDLDYKMHAEKTFFSDYVDIETYLRHDEGEEEEDEAVVINDGSKPFLGGFRNDSLLCRTFVMLSMVVVITFIVVHMRRKKNSIRPVIKECRNK